MTGDTAHHTDSAGDPGEDLPWIERYARASAYLYRQVFGDADSEDTG